MRISFFLHPSARHPADVYVNPEIILGLGHSSVIHTDGLAVLAEDRLSVTNFTINHQFKKERGTEI